MEGADHQHSSENYLKNLSRIGEKTVKIGEKTVKLYSNTRKYIDLKFPTQHQLSEKTTIVDSSDLRLTLARFLEIYFDEKVPYLPRFIPGKKAFYC